MERIFHKKALDCRSNSSYQYHRKCIENGEENMHTDLTVSKVKPGLWSGDLYHSRSSKPESQLFLISRKIRLSAVKLELVIDFRPKFS